MSTPLLYLQTGYELDGEGRILATREPDPRPGPLLTLVRGRRTVLHAVHADLPAETAREIGRLAAQEVPDDPRTEPLYADRYASLLGGRVRSGPAFAFPLQLTAVEGPVLIDEYEPLARHFEGWTREEVPGRTPIAAVLQDGDAVSVCCCARRSDETAEAGLETAAPFRGRGLAAQTTIAWAAAVRASGRIPLYSTEWSNAASLSVARKLGLTRYAEWWSIESA